MKFIVILLMCLAISFCVVKYSNPSHTMERREITQQEKRIVLAAIKKHGDFPIEQCKITGKMVMRRWGGVIKLN
jgi:hypothetical protein